MKTIEEKAKAYDEIIERAKTMLSAGEVMYGKENNASQLITDLIPDLAESEDERIRKGILNGMKYLQKMWRTSFYDIPMNDVIAWLERQKEPEKIHKPIEFKNDGNLVYLQEQPVKVGDKVSIIKKKEGIVTRISDGKARVETGDTMEIVNLSDLVTEQPVCEDFDLEADRFFRKLPLRANTPPIPDEYIDEETFDKIARHFYELGRQSKPKVCEELEEEIKSFALNFYQDNGNLPMVADIARHFAQWGAEHLRDTTKETDVLEKVKDLTHEVRVAYERGIEVGRKEQKEKFMKEAVEVWLAKDKDEILSLFQYEPTADSNGWLRGGRKLEVYDFFNYEDFYHLQDKMGMYDSMKVKLILIKEDTK